MKVDTPSGTYFVPKEGGPPIKLNFAGGGVVPGPMGMPVPAIVHGGEEVLTPAQRSGISSPSINVYVTGNNIASDYDIDRIGERMVDRIRLRTGLKI